MSRNSPKCETTCDPLVHSAACKQFLSNLEINLKYIYNNIESDKCLLETYSSNSRPIQTSTNTNTSLAVCKRMYENAIANLKFAIALSK